MGRLGSASAFFIIEVYKNNTESIFNITQTSKKYDILGYYLEGIWLSVSNVECFIAGFPCQGFQREVPVKLVLLL